MPTISEFFGLIIRMYYDDHNPPHFHVFYGEYEALISIDSLEVIKGNLPKRALALSLEWAQKHRVELRHDWTLAKQHRPLAKIKALE